MILKCDSLKKYPMYYLDNGGDQTIGYPTQSIEEKITLESTVLAMLDLPKRPTFIKNPMKKSASRYLLDIYKIISQDDATHDVHKRSVDSSFFSDLDIDELNKSNKIMAFSVRSVRSLGSLRGKVFWIDVKTLRGADQLLRAELRIYKSSDGDFSSSDTGEFESFCLIKQNISITKLFSLALELYFYNTMNYISNQVARYSSYNGFSALQDCERKVALNTIQSQ